MKVLAWTGLEVFLGPSSAAPPPLPLDWQPGDIRNCSYAPKQAWVGISAEDRGAGQEVLAAFDTATATSRILARAPRLLRHGFNPAGTQVCYTVPSERAGGADLLLLDIASGVTTALPAIVAHGSTPSWFPSGRRIAYASPDGQLELLSLDTGAQERLGPGTAPAIHPDGRRIALHRGGQVVIMDLQTGTLTAVPARRGWLQYRLTGSLSWSGDGRCLSLGFTSGLTGKNRTFRIWDEASGRQATIPGRSFRDAVLI